MARHKNSDLNNLAAVPLARGARINARAQNV